MGSGSMSGRKLEQTKDAMTTMLTKMSEKNLDNFNIITFEDDVKVWQPDVPVSVLEQLFANESSFDEIAKLDLSFSIPKKNGSLSEAYDFVLDMSAGGGTNINEALLKAIEIAKDVKKREEIDSKTEQLIVFLTDGEPTSGQDYPPAIRRNIKEANAKTKIPIYGLALGDGADFDLIKDISDESNGFAQRIYESGNSFEQLEDFYNKISDPKLKDVTFEYLVNGERIVPENLTTTTIDQVFGSNEYSIAGTFPEEEEVNEIQVIMKAKNQIGSIEKFFYLRPCYIPHQVTASDSSGKILISDLIPPPSKHPRIINPDRCIPAIIPQPIWKQSPTEIFMERLWAYKRINYLLADSTECTKAISTHDEVLENTTAFSEERILLIDLIDNVNKEEEETNDCEDEATKLALKYNFVTDLTSLVIEEDDDYINKGPIEIGKKPRPAYHGTFASYASYGAAPQPFRRGPASSSSYGVRSSLSALSPMGLSGFYSKSSASKGASKRNRNRSRPRRPSRPRLPSPTSPTTTTTTQAP